MSRLPFPNEILVEIFRLLPFDDVTSTVFVCRQFNDVISSNWHHMQKIPVDLCIQFYGDCSEMRLWLRPKQNKYSDFSVHLKISDQVHQRTTTNLKYPYRIESFRQCGLIFQLLKQKENSNKTLTHSFIATEPVAKLSYEKEKHQLELAELLQLIVETFNVQKLLMGAITTALPTVFDYVVECFKSLNSKTIRSIPFNLLIMSTKEVQVYRALKSNLVEISVVNEPNLLLLEMDVSEIQISKMSPRNIHIIGVLIEEWNKNQRNIRKLTMTWDHCFRSLTFGCLKRLLEQFSQCLIDFESDIEIRFTLNRNADLKTLRVHFDYNDQQRRLCIEELI